MEAAAASSSSSLPVLAHPATPLPPFLTKCYQMVDDPSTDPTVSWSATGNSLVVWDPHIFSRDLLPQYFKHNNLSSFVRQLNTYGFHKMDPDRWEFANKDFLRGHKHSLKTIRKRTTQISAQTESSQGKSAPKACVEVGKFWSAEEMERLKRDKNALMQELMILRQDQQSSDSQLCSLTVRLKVMEEHQQEMLSFLAMVVQSPGFLVQLLQQNKNNRCRTKTNKKRRHPALKHGLDVAEEASFDGQIVRYQPPVTESSKSLLEPIWNAGVTTGWDPLADGITDLHINVDGLPFELTSTLETKEDILSDMPEEEWAQLIASLTSENNRETDPYNMDISAFGMDFQLPECGIQVIEQMDVEQLASHIDNLRWT